MVKQNPIYRTSSIYTNKMIKRLSVILINNKNTKEQLRDMIIHFTNTSANTDRNDKWVEIQTNAALIEKSKIQKLKKQLLRLVKTAKFNDDRKNDDNLESISLSSFIRTRRYVFVYKHYIVIKPQNKNCPFFFIIIFIYFTIKN